MIVLRESNLTQDELLALLCAARAHRERDWLMILVAYWHGLRASEVVNLKAHSVTDGFITVRRLKKSLKTTQQLIRHPNPLLDEGALAEYARNQSGNQRLFPVSRVQFWRLIQRYAGASGLPKRKAHPHALKHTIAIQTIHSAGIENTRQWLGHKSMASTGEYLRVSDQDAGKAVQKALGGV